MMTWPHSQNLTKIITTTIKTIFLTSHLKTPIYGEFNFQMESLKKYFPFYGREEKLIYTRLVISK